jgi:AcrR family transcriptional regulator
MDKPRSDIGQGTSNSSNAELGTSQLRQERRDASEHRCRILSVARKLFGECGAESVSMHQIAQTAGVGQGTLYRRYAHKGELCLDIVQDSVNQLLQDIESGLSETQLESSALNQLDSVIVRIVEFTDEKANLLAVIKSAFSCEQGSTQYEHTFFRQLHVIVSTLLERAIAQAETAPLDTTFTADALLSALSPDLFLFQRQHRCFSKEEIIAGIRRIYITGLKKTGTDTRTTL